MKVLLEIACAAFLASNPIQAQDWYASEKVDLLTDVKSTEFTLVGKFIKPPIRGVGVPRLVVQCDHGSGSRSGRRAASYLVVSAVLQSTSVNFRIDDGKPQTGFNWKLSSDLSSAFFDAPDLTEFLYGHMFKHKIDAGKPVHKLVIVMTEYAAGSVAMQFDMPDPTEVAKACGIIK